MVRGGLVLSTSPPAESCHRDGFSRGLLNRTVMLHNRAPRLTISLPRGSSTTKFGSWSEPREASCAWKIIAC